MKRAHEDLPGAARREALDELRGVRDGVNEVSDEALAGALADAAIRVLTHDLRAMLNPELYPGYDPGHVYWDDQADFEVNPRWGVIEKSEGLHYAVSGGEEIGPLPEDEAVAAAREQNIEAAGKAGGLPPFEWSADTIEWVSEWVERISQEVELEDEPGLSGEATRATVDRPEAPARAGHHPRATSGLTARPAVPRA